MITFHGIVLTMMRNANAAARFRTLAAAAGLALAPAVLGAQRQAPIGPEDRIRIVAPAAGLHEPVAGTVLQVRADTVVLQMNAVQMTVPISAIRTLERSAGQGSRVRYGIYGGLLGTALGYAAGQVQYRAQAGYFRDRQVHGRDSHVVEFTVAGAALGALVGALLPGERWKPAPVLQSFVPAGAGGAGVSFRVPL